MFKPLYFKPLALKIAFLLPNLHVLALKCLIIRWSKLYFQTESIKKHFFSFEKSVGYFSFWFSWILVTQMKWLRCLFPLIYTFNSNAIWRIVHDIRLKANWILIMNNRWTLALRGTPRKLPGPLVYISNLGLNELFSEASSLLSSLLLLTT